MSKQPCPIEPLISSKYCTLSVCMECSVVNLSLPGRISFQFDVQQFLDLAESFHTASQNLRSKLSNKQQGKNVIKLTHLH
jgi:hypothetical protein